jgi:hypothetical protein
MAYRLSKFFTCVRAGENPRRTAVYLAVQELLE